MCAKSANDTMYDTGSDSCESFLIKPRHRGLGEERTTSVRFFGRMGDQIRAPTQKAIIEKANWKRITGTPAHERPLTSVRVRSEKIGPKPIRTRSQARKV